MNTYILCVTGIDKVIFKLSEDFERAKMIWRQESEPNGEWTRSNMNRTDIDNGAWSSNGVKYTILTEAEVMLEML